MSRNIVLVSSLLPPSTPHLLAYAIPVLLISLVTTFAGAFLTLDRTRSFAPIDDPVPTRHPNDEEDGIGYRISTFLNHYKIAGVSEGILGEMKKQQTVLKKEKRASWRLEGGIGGLMIGWLCGVYVSTYLAILIVNRTSASPLGPVQFLAIWILSSTTLAVIGGRWRIAALFFAGICGGLSFTILLSIIFYPSLIARLVIAAVFSALLTVLCLLPLPNIQHVALRTSTALAGAFGMVISIALFKSSSIDVAQRPEGSWANAWLVLTVPQVVGMRGSLEKGLSAAMVLLAICGAAVDWFAKRKLGENPDKEWDRYLAEYGKSLPFSEHREGVFKPFRSFWSRAFHGKEHNEKEILFPPDSQLISKKSHPDFSEHSSPATTTRALPPAPSFHPVPTRKMSTRPTLLKSRPTLDNHSDDSSSDEEAATGLGGPPKFRPYAVKRSSTTHTGTTLVGGISPVTQKSGFNLRTPTTKDFIYSEDEQDVTAVSRSLDSIERDRERRSPGWKPAFLQRRQDKKAIAKYAGRSGSLSTQASSPVLSRILRSDSPDQMSESSAERHRSAFQQSPRNPSTPESRSLASLAPQRDALSLPESVPATPSLLKAIDRVNAARGVLPTPSSSDVEQATSQNQYGNAMNGLSPHRKASLPDDFWEEVQAKAKEAETGKRH